MRKLKVQMQVTVDGFVAGSGGQLDWMTAPDEKLLGFINNLTDTSDTILLGRRMTAGFISYWENAATQPESPEYTFARKMVDIPKVVFSGTLTSIPGTNVRVERGDLVQAVTKLKSLAGKDIIVYGGATFVASLLENALIDQLHLFVNPVAIGRGMQIFKDRKALRLTGSTAYPHGIVVNSYEPAQPRDRPSSKCLASDGTRR